MTTPNAVTVKWRQRVRKSRSGHPIWYARLRGYGLVVHHHWKGFWAANVWAKVSNDHGGVYRSMHSTRHRTVAKAMNEATLAALNLPPGGSPDGL